MVQRSKRALKSEKAPRSSSSAGAKASGLPVLSAGELIALGSRAFGEDDKKVVDQIARMAALSKGGDSDPTRETILSYIKAPAAKPGQEPKRRNRDTPVHYKLAHLVLNYLDGRRAPDHIDPIVVKDPTSLRDARDYCKTILSQERERRFERPLGSDWGMQAIIASLCGVYALCRKESSDGKYHQELLILQNSNTRENPRCHCTLVSASVVVRGEWMLVGNLVHCSMSGYRRDNTHEVCGLYLSHVSGNDLLSGFLAGTGTDVRRPVAMPVVAIRISEVSESILNLGDLGDQAILSKFTELDVRLDPFAEQLDDIFAKDMTPVIFHASTCNSEVRKVFDGGKMLVGDNFRKFCQSTID